MMDERFICVVSFAQVPREYRGMDGVILQSADNRKGFEEGCRTARPLDVNLSLCDPMSMRNLHIVSQGASSSRETEQWFGWDVGHLNSDDSVYSLIVHYLLNNRPGLRSDFVLNDNLMFALPSEAWRLLDEWSAWAPDDPGDKEVFLPNDQIDVWAASRIVLPGEDRPATWNVKYP